jgi:hypothetical protein
LAYFLSEEVLGAVFSAPFIFRYLRAFWREYLFSQDIIFTNIVIEKYHDKTQPISLKLLI